MGRRFRESGPYAVCRYGGRARAPFPRDGPDPLDVVPSPRHGRGIHRRRGIHPGDEDESGGGETRLYLITSERERLGWRVGTFWSRWFGPKIERGWVKLWGGRYHMDPSAFVNLRFRSFWMPWTFRREWGIYWLGGEQ